MNLRLLTLIPLMSFTTSCGGGDTFDRNAMLTSLGANVIVPSYAALADSAAALDAAADAFCTTPTESSLDALQLALTDAHAALVRTEAFSFGPYMALPDPAETALNFWPARTNLADDVLAGVDPIAVATLTNAQKGFPILDYLLFDPVGGDVAVLAAFVDGGTGPRRCAYLDVITDDVITRTATLHAEWVAPEGYANELATAGQTSEVYPLTRLALSDVLERVVFTLEDMRDMKLGAPLGLLSDNLAHPELVEAPYAGRSFGALEDDLASIEAVFTGDYAEKNGIGLSEWLVTRNATLDADVRAQIAVVRGHLLAFTSPLATAIVDDREAVVALHTEIRNLHRLFGVDVAGALAVTISFNDTDGD